jgi:hypothetical protein
VTTEGVTAYRYCPGWITGFCLLLGLAVLLLAGACRRGVPVVDTAPKPAIAEGTISGTVHGPEGTSPVGGRTVEIVNVDTKERHTVTTSSNGGFTIKLPPGKYRLELQLQPGETLVKHPDIVKLDRGDIDSQIEFVVATARLLRPRGPAYHLDNGLGAPIA